MLSLQTEYRVGARALIYMILRKLKYPFIFAVITVLVSIIFSYAKQRLSVPSGLELYGHGGQILHVLMIALYVIRYVWIFIILLAIFLGLTALPEYFGMSVAMDEKALYIGLGILSRRYTSIPYHQIQKITILNKPMTGLFGLSTVVVSLNGGKTDEVVIPLMHAKLARDLEVGLLARTERT